jgi:hypothetical protein
MIKEEALKLKKNELIDIDQLTEILGISEMSVYRIRYKGELLPKAKWGGKNYWDGTEVMDYCIKRGVIKEEVILTT